MPYRSTVIIQLGRSNLPTESEHIDADGAEFALYLESEIENKLEQNDIAATVHVSYQANGTGEMPNLIIAENGDDQGTLETIVDNATETARSSFQFS